MAGPEVRPASAVDERSLLSFYESQFPLRAAFLSRHWRWLYRVGRFPGVGPLVLVDEGRIVGHAGAIPLTIRRRGRDATAIWYVDFAVLPEAQGLGLGRALSEAWMKMASDRVTFCNERSIRVFRKLGWRERLDARARSLPLEPSGPAASRGPAAAALGRLLAGPWRSALSAALARAPELTIAPLPGDVSRLVRLLGDGAPAEAAVVRDEDWIRWRLLDHPRREEHLLAEHAGVGAILRLFTSAGRRRAHLLHVGPGEEAARAELVRGFARWAAERGADDAWMATSDPVLLSAASWRLPRARAALRLELRRARRRGRPVAGSADARPRQRPRPDVPMLKDSLLAAALALGLDAPLRWLRRRRAVVLMYHGFTDRPSDGLVNYQGNRLQAATFRRQLEFLRSHCSLVTLREVIASLSGGPALPDYAVALTIDDGYESVRALAYPELLAARAPATLFTATEFVDRRAPLWPDRLEHAFAGGPAAPERRDRLRALQRRAKALPPAEREAEIAAVERELGRRLVLDESAPETYRPVSWSQCREMADSGLVEIGSHTHTHTIMTVLGEQEAREELAVSKRLVEENVGRPCDLFCYPNGDYDDFSPATSRLLKEAGFLCGLTTVAGFAGPGDDPYALRRFGTDDRDSFARFRMTFSVGRNLLQGARRLRSPNDPARG